MNATSAFEKPQRLLSLDVLRGITIAFMILVNDNGDERHAYWVLKHAAWNGWTPTDLVFPTFLFVVGISLVFSTDSRLARGAQRSTLFFHALRRAVILFLLGLVVNGSPFFHLGTLRIYGVLQRIAICYFIASALYLIDRGAKSKIVIAAAALIGYWVIMRYIPVPGYGTPTVNIPLLSHDANWVAYIDRHIFPGRLYEGTRDPEGLLSDLPAVATTLIGVLTALWLRTARPLVTKFRGLLIAALVLLTCGRIWNIWFPINKKLWTSSYVLWAAGCSLLGLALCYWAVEIRQWKRGWTFPWLVFGSNAITAYVFSEVLASIIGSVRIHGQSLSRTFYSHTFAHIPDPAFGSLLYSLTYVAVCFIPVLILYRRKIFIKV
ncbi:acyltransferase family protein [Acidipila rosea]|uniref:Putative acyltransferase n=1 Tax=Acidipila rosea TaxID=768535 RepID=A0A4R1L7E8_9BACT|nr:heparan-alpha-glucosaminide N-acetyltransferase domain-containing protein [Acidipila rosea]TCK74114.1 putative acyltransferase [Acidipila rosea]